MSIQIEPITAQCQFESGLDNDKYFKIHKIKKQTIFHSNSFKDRKYNAEESFYDLDGKMIYRIHCEGDTDRFYYENGQLQKVFISSCEGTLPDITIEYKYVKVDKIDITEEAYSRSYSKYRSRSLKSGNKEYRVEFVILDTIGNTLTLPSWATYRVYRFKSNNCIDSIFVLNSGNDTVGVNVYMYDELSRVIRVSGRPTNNGEGITEDIMSLDELGLPQFYVKNWVESGIVLNTECTYYFYEAGLLTKTVTINSNLSIEKNEYNYEFY